MLGQVKLCSIVKLKDEALDSISEDTVLVLSREKHFL